MPYYTLGVHDKTISISNIEDDVIEDIGIKFVIYRDPVTGLLTGIRVTADDEKDANTKAAQYIKQRFPGSL